MGVLLIPDGRRLGRMLLVLVDRELCRMLASGRFAVVFSSRRFLQFDLLLTALGQPLLALRIDFQKQALYGRRKRIGEVIRGELVQQRTELRPFILGNRTLQ